LTGQHEGGFVATLLGRIEFLRFIQRHQNRQDDLLL
jgi:hypothetical protein